MTLVNRVDDCYSENCLSWLQCRGGGSNFPVVRLDAKLMVKEYAIINHLLLHHYGTIIAHSILTSSVFLVASEANWLTFSRTLGKDMTTWLVGTIANTWQKQLIASRHVRESQ